MFIYTKSAFVFCLLRYFYIFHDNIVPFFSSLERLSLERLLCSLSLLSSSCLADELLDISLSVKKVLLYM